MGALIEKNASAFAAPGCAPITGIIVILRAVPLGDEPACSSDLTELTRCDNVVHLAVNGICALIEHHTEVKLGMLICLCDHLAHLKCINARRLFTHNVKTVLERLDCKIGVEIMRNCDKDRVNKSGCDQLVTLVEDHGHICLISFSLYLGEVLNDPLAANLTSVCNSGDNDIGTLASNNVFEVCRADVTDSDNT